MAIYHPLRRRSQVSDIVKKFERMKTAYPIGGGLESLENGGRGAYRG